MDAGPGEHARGIKKGFWNVRFVLNFGTKIFLVVIFSQPNPIFRQVGKPSQNESIRLTAALAGHRARDPL
jgi:hypothetical protein